MPGKKKQGEDMISRTRFVCKSVSASVAEPRIEKERTRGGIGVLNL